jgi:hypothetical protein
LGLRAKLEAVQTLLYNAYQQAMDVATILKSYATAFRDRVRAVIAQIDNFFAYLYSISSLLPFSTSLIPNTFIPDLQSVNIPALRPAIVLDGIWAEVSGFLDQFNTAISGITANIRAPLVQWKTDVNIAVGPIAGPSFFTDYNPPDVELFAQNQKQEKAEQDEEFLSKSAVALNQYDQIPPPPPPTKKSTNGSLIFAPNLNFRSPVALHFEPFRGSVAVTPFMQVFYFIASLFLIADTIWRVTSSVRIVVRYMSASHVGLPTVDCRAKSTAAVNERTSLRVARVLTHPFTIIAVWTVIAILVVSAFASVYVPMYEGYINGCVESRRGTILSNNSYAVVYNYAASDGDKELARGLSAFDATRGEACGSNLEQSNKEYSNNQQALQASTDNHGTSSANVELVAKCVVMASFPDPLYYYAALGHEHPSIIIGRARSSDCRQTQIQQYQRLENQAFNCSLLPVCQVTCNGPDRALLTVATQKSGCTTEWMLHAAVIRTLITVLVFICINLSRMWFIEGLRRYHWRSLTPPTGFTYLGTVSRAGKMSRNMDENVVKRLDTTIARWERVAYLLFGLAVLIHVPYIVVLAATAGPFAYQA